MAELSLEAGGRADGARRRIRGGMRWSARPPVPDIGTEAARENDIVMGTSPSANAHSPWTANLVVRVGRTRISSAAGTAGSGRRRHVRKPGWLWTESSTAPSARPLDAAESGCHHASMEGGLIPEPIRRDIETGVAAALDEGDLRQALARVGVTDVPDDQNDVDLVVILVPRTHGNSWPFTWRGSDTFSPYRNGYIVAAIQALDMVAGRPPRLLKDYQREWVETWESQSGQDLG